MFGALVVATSAPGLAVAHGSAHLHAAEHAAEDAEHRSADLERSATATIADAGHDAHEHLLVDAALTPRNSTAQFVVAAVVQLVLEAGVSVAATAPRAEPADVPDGPPPDRASQPRAPPLG